MYKIIKSNKIIGIFECVKFWIKIVSILLQIIGPVLPSSKLVMNSCPPSSAMQCQLNA